MVINPSIEVYLLDPQGTILAYSAPPGKGAAATGDPGACAPVLRGSSPWPILGDDPRQLTQQKIFSVAPDSAQGALEATSISCWLVKPTIP